MDNESKQKIIEATIKLIEETKDGNPSIRDISLAAGTSLGLIHYHFKSRENLIREAVRFHVNQNVIFAYSPKSTHKNIQKSKTDFIAEVIMEVLTYLVDHPQIARASILNDLSFPAKGDNSDNTWEGFAIVLEKALRRPLNKTEKISIWTLIGSVHEAFLRPELFAQKTGLDVNKNADRKMFSNYLAGLLLSNDT